MASIAELNVIIGAKVEQLERGLRNAERSLERSGRKLARLGNNLSTSVTLPLVAIGVAAVKTSADFETSFTKLNTLVGISGKTLEDFRDGINNLSGPLGKSKTELSDALFVITSAGQKGSDALLTLEQASKASSIGLGETTDIARAATAASQAYGKETLSTTDAIDKFTAIVREGNLNAAELAPTLGKVLPIAAQLGVSFDEVGANIAAFTRLGVSAPEAVTALKSLLSSLVKPSKEAQGELKKLGLTADELRDQISNNGLAATLQGLIKAYDGNVAGLSRLFPNIEGLTNALGTAGAQGEEYAEIVQSIQQANGIVNEGFETVSQTANFKLQKALVDLTNVATQFGSVLIPVIVDLLGAVTPLLQKFGALDESTKKIIVSIGLVAAAAGPAIKAFGTMQLLSASFAGSAKNLVGGLKKATAAFSGLNTVMKASVIGLAVVAVTALAAAYSQYNRSLTDSEKVQQNIALINQRAEISLASQKAEIKKLTAALQNKNNTDERNAEIRRRIIALNPGYLKGLIDEKSSIQDVTAVLDTYISKLQNAARLRAANERLTELYKQLDDLNQLQEESDPTLGQQFVNLITGRGNAATQAYANAKSAAQNYQATVSDLEKQIKSTVNQIANLEGTNDGTVADNQVTIPSDNTNVPTFNLNGAIGDSIDDTTEKVEKLELTLRQYQQAIADLQTEQLVEQNDLVSGSLEKMNEIYAKNSEEIAKNAEASQAAAAELAAFNDSINNAIEGGLETLAGQFGEFTGQLFTGAASIENFGVTIFNTLAGVLSQLGDIAIQAGIGIEAIKAAFSTLSGVGAIAIGIGLKAFSSIIKSRLKETATPFADGGIVSGPTYALIGEYSGAANNPEVVAPLNRLKSLLGDTSGGGQLFARVEGKDLLFVLDRARNSQSRTRGY